MKKGQGGPSRWDLDDLALRRRDPEIVDEYYDAHMNVRISKLTGFAKKIKSLTALVQALLIDVAFLKAKVCEKVDGENTEPGRPSGRKLARPTRSSSSSRGKRGGSKKTSASDKTAQQ